MGHGTSVAIGDSQRAERRLQVPDRHTKGNRPRESLSNVAAAFAIVKGPRYGRTSTLSARMLASTMAKGTVSVGILTCSGQGPHWPRATRPTWRDARPWPSTATGRPGTTRAVSYGPESLSGPQLFLGQERREPPMAEMGFRPIQVSCQPRSRRFDTTYGVPYDGRRPC